MEPQHDVVDKLSLKIFYLQFFTGLLDNSKQNLKKNIEKGQKS
jgi:hypothetical protein